MTLRCTITWWLLSTENKYYYINNLGNQILHKIKISYENRNL